MISYQVIFLIICPLIFIAGFIDSVAGGGGLISLPAYIFAGVPIHVAYGTNKFANGIGTGIATLKFLKSGEVKLKSALISAGGALVGSWFGARLIVLLDEKYLKYSLMIILPIVAVFLIFNRNFGSEDKVRDIPKVRGYVYSLVIGLIMGTYDGFFGPGTGTFLVIAFTTICGFSMVTASGNAKVVNLSSNMAALAVYIASGNVDFRIGIPAAICAILGNYLGANLAIKKGAKFIKPIMVLVICLLFSKVIYDFL
jgi:uncharacterized protein